MCYFVQVIIDILIVASSTYIIVVIKINCTVTLSVQTKLFLCTVQYSSTQTLHSHVQNICGSIYFVFAASDYSTTLCSHCNEALQLSIKDF